MTALAGLSLGILLVFVAFWAHSFLLWEFAKWVFDMGRRTARRPVPGIALTPPGPSSRVIRQMSRFG